MKKHLVTGNRASITIYAVLFVSAILIIGLLLTDVGEYLFQYQHFERENYLKIQNEIKKFDNNLFNRYGILGLKKSDYDVLYSNSLGVDAVLKKSIVQLMIFREINDLSKDLIEEIVENKTLLNIINELEETIALKNTINKQILEFQIPSEALLNKLYMKVLKNWMYFEYPYDDFKNILTFDFSESDLIQLEINDEIKKLQYEYFEIFNSDILENSISKIFLVEYIIDYLGYSSNENKKEIYTAEYAISSVADKDYQKIIVESEIFSLRFLMNATSILKSPMKMQEYIEKSGGDIKIQTFLIILDCIEMAFVDTELIYNGSAVPLIKENKDVNSKKFENGLYYKDYLKILLYFIPEKLLVDRIRESIENNIFIDVSEYFTTIKTEEKFSYSFSTFDYKIEFNKVFEGDVNE